MTFKVGDRVRSIKTQSGIEPGAEGVVCTVEKSGQIGVRLNKKTVYSRDGEWAGHDLDGKQGFTSGGWYFNSNELSLIPPPKRRATTKATKVKRATKARTKKTTRRAVAR